MSSEPSPTEGLPVTIFLNTPCLCPASRVRVRYQTIAQQPYQLVLVSAHGVQPEDASVTIQEQLLAEVGEHRGAGAADRLYEACVSVLDVTLIPGSLRTGTRRPRSEHLW
jgi:hypothetical protein